MEIKQKIFEHQKTIIQLLAQYEKTVGKLYQFYSEKFPAERAFWESLFEAEEHHAFLLEMLASKMASRHIFHNLREFDPERIRKEINHLEKKIETLEKNSPEEFGFENAIKDALETEASILEAHFYDIAGSDMEEFQVVANILKKETRLHVKQIEEKMINFISSKKKEGTDCE